MRRVTKPKMVVAAAMVCAAFFSVAVPADASPAYDAAKSCRVALTAKGKAYAKTRRSLLLSCVGKLLKCSLQEEIDKTNVKTCRDAATAACIANLDTADQGLLAAQAKFSEKVGLACAAHGVSNMCSNGPGGLWFGDDPTCGSSDPNTCGASADLNNLLTCVREEIDTLVDSNVGAVAPRAGMLLDNIGLGDEFPDLPRPPTTLVTVTAASPGTLTTPGTIMLPAGNSLTVIGDDTSLPCGSNSTNGSLTVQVGSGSSCANIVVEQQVVLSEPYGSTRPAVFGPYNDDKIMCLNLKDQGGMGCTTGPGSEVLGGVDVDVPTALPTPAPSSGDVMACHNKMQGKLKGLSSFASNKLHACGDKVAKCELQKEIDGSCSATYDKPCGTLVSKLETKLGTFKSNVTLTGKCPIVPFAYLRSFSGGLGFSNGSGPCAAAASLSELADCIYGSPGLPTGASCKAQQKSLVRDPRIADSFGASKANIDPASNLPCLITIN